jgi:nucleolar protein 4
MESKYGKVLDVHLPRVQNNLHVGFCFVTFENPKDAQKAVEEKQVDIAKRTVNMDWSLPKKLHQQQKQQRHQEHQNDDIKSVEENTDDKESDDRDSQESKSENENDDASESEEDDGGSKDDDAADSGEQSDSEEEEDEKEPVDDSVSKKCSLFLRNLPFDTTRHDLFELFSKYGFIKAIYLVKDNKTGMLKGTAFVTYSKPQSAKRAINAAASSGTSDDVGVSSFISQRQASTDGVTGSTKGCLLLKGRKILVDLAVDKETAAAFDSNEHKIPAPDRRNLYLQAEARVESSSSDPKANNADTWDALPPQDQKKRQTALKDKTTKLQSPIFFINPNRLSIRNMAKHIDEAELQKLCQLAVKRGLEKRLVAAKDQIAHWRALGEMSTREILSKVQEMEATNEDVIPGWDDKTNIKEYIPSVYIDRDFGPNGKKADAPSRGFGFVEFKYHAHALACLRELNNNPAYSREYAAGGKAADALKKKSPKSKKAPKPGNGEDYVGEDGRVRTPRLIVDFTVENKVKAKKQADRRLQQQLNQSKQKLEKLEKEEHSEEKKRRSRGAIQREKKRQKRESGEEEAERQAKLRAKALAEAKEELRKERQDLKKKRIEEMKRRSVKPPKKKQKADEDDEKFDSIVRSYTSKLESAREEKEAKTHQRAALKQKRWFE